MVDRPHAELLDRKRERGKCVESPLVDDVGDVPLAYTRAVAFSIDVAVRVYIELHAYCKYSISIYVRSRDAWIGM